MGEAGTVVGLDLGTTKVCAVMAERSDTGSLRITGVGNSPTDGLRRGVVVDVDRTVQSITRAVREAEVTAGSPVSEVVVGIAGEHIQSRDSCGAVAVEGRGNLITALDRERAIAAARTVAIPFDEEVLHVIPQEFTLDAQEGVRNPVGMFGVRLETSVHIVTGAVTAVQNICTSVQRAGLVVRDIVLQPLASSRAVLSDDDREMGVCMVDMGGGTADLALFVDGSVRHTAVIGIGGQNVTSDVAICLRTSWPHAERLKREHGVAQICGVDEDELVEVPGVAGRSPVAVPRCELAAIIEARMEEIYSRVQDEITRSGYGESLATGVVLTGGAAQVEGADRLAEAVLGKQVRLGSPSGFDGLGDRITSPIYATAAGLVLLGASEDVDHDTPRIHRGLTEAGFETVAGRMREWVSGLF